MKKKTTEQKVIKRTISLPPKVFARAERNAARHKRSFSNYMAVLISGDTLDAIAR